MNAAPPVVDLTALSPELLAQLKALGLDVSPAAGPIIEGQTAPAPAGPPTSASTAEMRLQALLDARSNRTSGLMGAIDLTQVVTKDYRLLPLETTIEAQIVNREIGKSSTGNDQIVLGLKVTYPTEFAGVDLQDYVILDPHDPKRSWKFKSLCEACTTEIDGHEVSLLHNGRYIGDDDGAAFLGNIVKFQADHNEYNGRIYNKVKGSYTAGTETPGLK